jgi:T5SS/PEP-CTERM-associated repeat protein
MKKCWIYRLVSMTFLSFWVSTSCYAQNVVQWTGGDGNWNDPTHWNSGSVPSSNDATFIELPVTVTIDQHVPNPFDIGLRTSGTGSTLQLIHGGTLSTSGEIDVGGGSGITGTVVVNGTGSSLTTSFVISMGRAGGNRVLTIQNGGIVQGVVFGTGTARILVDGSGSQWINNSNVALVFDGNTVVTASNGATVNFGRTSINANSPSGQFTLNVGNGGTGASVTASGPLVNQGGAMTVNFNHGDTVTFSPALLAGERFP